MIRWNLAGDFLKLVAQVVVRVGALIGSLGLAAVVVSVVWRECNAHAVSVYCSQTSIGEGRDSVVRRAREAGFRISSDTTKGQLGVWRRSWAGMGICTIEFQDDKVTFAKFEDS